MQSLYKLIYLINKFIIRPFLFVRKLVFSTLKLCFNPKEFFKKLFNLPKKIKEFYKNTSDEIRHQLKLIELRKKHRVIPTNPSNILRAIAIIVFGLFAFSIPVLFFHFSKDLLNNILTFVKGQSSGNIFDIVQPLILVLSTPILFVVWLFRDRNKIMEIENQRKDTNLKEFQQLQAWATGNIDNNYAETEEINNNQIKTTVRKAKTNEALALQISALHQLRDYLKGVYGDNFRRPAFEIFTAVLAFTHREILENGVPKNLFDNLSVNSETYSSNRSDIRNETYRKKLAELIESNPLCKQLNRIVVEDWFSLLVDHDFPLNTISLVGVVFPSGVYLKKLKLPEVHLGGAVLQQAHLEGAYLIQPHLEGAYLTGAHLEGADLTGAHLEGADLTGAHLEGANLRQAHLEGANLRQAHLEGAYLRWLHLEGANLTGAHLEGANLTGAHLEGADLTGAHLEGANLTEAHLEGAYLTGAHLKGISFDREDIDILETLTDRIKKATKRIRNRASQEVALYGFPNRGKLDAEIGNELIKKIKEIRFMGKEQRKDAIKRIEQAMKKPTNFTNADFSPCGETEAEEVIKRINKAVEKAKKYRN